MCPVWHVSYCTKYIAHLSYFGTCHTVQNWLYSYHLSTCNTTQNRFIQVPCCTKLIVYVSCLDICNAVQNWVLDVSYCKHWLYTCHFWHVSYHTKLIIHLSDFDTSHTVKGLLFTYRILAHVIQYKMVDKIDCTHVILHKMYFSRFKLWILPYWKNWFAHVSNFDTCYTLRIGCARVPFGHVSHRVLFSMIFNVPVSTLRRVTLY